MYGGNAGGEDVEIEGETFDWLSECMLMSQVPDDEKVTMEKQKIDA